MKLNFVAKLSYSRKFMRERKDNLLLKHEFGFKIQTITKCCKKSVLFITNSYKKNKYC